MVHQVGRFAFLGVVEVIAGQLGFEQGQQRLRQALDAPQEMELVDRFPPAILGVAVGGASERIDMLCLAAFRAVPGLRGRNRPGSPRNPVEPGV
jgi:hypothetical protein